MFSVSTLRNIVVVHTLRCLATLVLVWDLSAQPSRIAGVDKQIAVHRLIVCLHAFATNVSG